MPDIRKPFRAVREYFGFGPSTYDVLTINRTIHPKYPHVRIQSGAKVFEGLVVPAPHVAEFQLAAIVVNTISQDAIDWNAVHDGFGEGDLDSIGAIA